MMLIVLFNEQVLCGCLIIFHER